MRNFLRAVWSQLIRIAPPWLAYRLRYLKELLVFRYQSNVHDLPPIFHYWSNRYLGPQIFNPYGIRDPEHFFFKFVSEQRERHPAARLTMVSIGSGNCDMECRLASALRAEGIDNFVIECIDINQAMLDRGIKLAEALGVASYIATTISDFNNWQPVKQYDVVIANQCLHHIIELEDLFSKVKQVLTDDGRFLVSDMIGRNGHLRWPEALGIINTMWSQLPEKYKYNHMRQRQEPQFINHDCSTSSFEGIRAQDILPLLVANFHFELFLPFGNLIFVFIDRTFGYNFNPEVVEDRQIIDKIHARDEEGMHSGELKPTQMLAVLCKTPVAQPRLRNARLTPEFCVRVPS
ncbi:MAG: class I SAM-dependent methyltransferase [Pseudomonadota bacterium]